MLRRNSSFQPVRRSTVAGATCFLRYIRKRSRCRPRELSPRAARLDWRVQTSTGSWISRSWISPALSSLTPAAIRQRHRVFEFASCQPFCKRDSIPCNRYEPRIAILPPQIRAKRCPPRPQSHETASILGADPVYRTACRVVLPEHRLLCHRNCAVRIVLFRWSYLA
jgi:hypothetical protein